jgi:hypothetical protein
MIYIEPARIVAMSKTASRKPEKVQCLTLMIADAGSFITFAASSSGKGLFSP